MAVQKAGPKPAQTNQTKKPTAPKTTPAPSSKGPQLDSAIINQLAQLQQAKNTPPAPAETPKVSLWSGDDYDSAGSEDQRTSRQGQVQEYPAAAGPGPR